MVENKYYCLNPRVLFNDDTTLNLFKKITMDPFIKNFVYFNSLAPQWRQWILDNMNLYKIQLINCRKCNRCLHYKRNDWLKRAQIERLNWKFCYFITLTFDNEHLKTPWLEKRFFSDWIKKSLKPSFYFGSSLSYFATGEYGSHTQRKHYHAVIFCNQVLDDLQEIKKTKKGNIIYSSKTLERLWSNGFVSVAPVDSEAVFKYVLKYSNKVYAGKNNINVPVGYLGEHLIISHGFGNYIKDGALIDDVPNSIIKNSKQRIYHAKRKFLAGIITLKEYQDIWLQEQKYLKYTNFQKYKDIWNNLYNQDLNNVLYSNAFKEDKYKGEL